MKNKTITYSEYNENINKYNYLIKQGFKPIIKKNWFKIGLGFVCLGIAILPNGLAPLMLPLSFLLLGFSYKDVEEWKRKIKYKIRGCKI